MQANWKQLLTIAWFAALMLGGTLVILGKDVLIPFVIAILLWYLIDALTEMIGKLNAFQRLPPRWLALLGSLIIIVSVLYVVGAVVSANITAVYDTAPLYKENIERLSTRLSIFLGMESQFDIAVITREINFVPWLQSIALGLANTAGLALLVALYVIFLLIEQRNFPAKMQAIFPDPRARKKVSNLLSEMQKRIETYVWVKTLMSLLTGGASYVILLLVGIDYAAFWGLLIFLLNYIPAIGSLLAITFPTLLALVQFDNFLPALVALIGCGVVQFLIGSVLEPRIAGNRLNISPLVVILSLAVWGAIWGIPGMFLSIPLTVMLMIVFAHFPATRPIAILISGAGELDFPNSKK